MTQLTPSELHDSVDTAAARHRALDALRALSSQKPVAEINYGDIASEAGLPWQTVKRLLGPRQEFAALLAGEVPEPIDTRDRVLESAARVFARKGYLGASLDEVAADANLTKGAVYWHFKSKNDLFFALLDSRFQSANEQQVPQALAQDALQKDPKEGMKALLAGVLERVRHDPDWPRLFLEFMGQARDPEVRAKLAGAYQASYRLSADVIAKQHAARGNLPPTDSNVLAIFWSALIDGLIMAWLLNPEMIDLEILTPRIVDLLWRGLDPAQDHSNNKAQ